MGVPITVASWLKKNRQFVADERSVTFALAPLDAMPAGIPREWREVLLAQDPVGALLGTLWAPLKRILPKTSAQLRKKLCAVGLLRTKEHPASLVYVFRAGRDIFSHRGFPPCRVTRKEARRLPKEFLGIYAVHNGWTDLHGFAGPMEQEIWSDPLDLIDEDEAKDLGVRNPTDLLLVYEDGGGASTGFDLSKRSLAGMTIDPGEGTLERHRNVLKVIDSAMADDLEDCDDAPKPAPAAAAKSAPPPGGRSPAPRYELREGSSSKFWQIAIKGSAVTTTFGRIGTTGQAKTTRFASAELARKKHDALIREKTKKGYRLAR